MNMKYLKYHFKRLSKSQSGSVLTEVALVVLFLMFLVIGMASLNIQMSSVENSGRSIKEVTDIATQMIIEDGDISSSEQDILLDMVSRRTNTPQSKVSVVLSRIQRNGLTGDYQINATHTMGGAPPPFLISLRQSPEPNPGIVLMGETITLDLSQEILVVYISTIFEGVPRGVVSPKKNELVSFAFLP